MRYVYILMIAVLLTSLSACTQKSPGSNGRKESNGAGRAEFLKILKKGSAIWEIKRTFGAPMYVFTPQILKGFSDPAGRRIPSDTDNFMFQINAKGLGLTPVLVKLRDSTAEIWVYRYQTSNFAFATSGHVWIFTMKDQKVSDWEFTTSDFSHGPLILERGGN